MGIYYSGKANQSLRHPDLYGIMLSYRDTGRQGVALESGARWMMDNGAFSGNFRESAWRKRLERFLPYRSQCDGIVIPDSVFLDGNGRFLKGDWRGTLKKLPLYCGIVSAMGYPVAYVLQDNHPTNLIPWDNLDVLFVGGTIEYKESFKVERIAKIAHSKGKLVHIGRVSSIRRLQKTWWADSWDGTTFKWDEQKKHDRFDPVLSGDTPLIRQFRLM